MEENLEKAEIGLIGLAVMGQNLALNIADRGFQVAVYNRTVTKVEEFLEGPAKGKPIVGAHSLKAFFSLLKRPKKVILMVKAGEAVDQFIQLCAPYLEAGDVLIDGGNSLFTDSSRRCLELNEKGVFFIGAGISGGEEGARHGPSLMPGGNEKGWPLIRPIFQAIAAKVEGSIPCCDWVGSLGSGHFVKMVHNGIEYGDMQLICEAYHLLKKGLGLKAEELSSIFKEWNSGELESYLIEITSHIFQKLDEDGTPLVDHILDVAGQKGTGKWTVVHALDIGMPVTLIGEAVFSRCLSSLKEERKEASKVLAGPKKAFEGDKKAFIEAIKKALYFAKIISYAQGFMMMRQASLDFDWNLNFGAIALMWRGGCIIRSRFLGKIKEAYNKNPKLTNLLFDPYFSKEIASGEKSCRFALIQGIEMGIPLPCLSTALAFYDGLRQERLPANLLQAQRDYFGAHTYERLDRPRGSFFHTNWTGEGGAVSSTSYTV